MPVSDTDYMVRMARTMDPLREPVLRAAIRDLQLPAGSQGLDAGCGIGLQSILLAEMVGPEGHVTGLDISPALLATAEQVVDEAGLAGRVSLREGDVRRLPFDDDTFDWAWSVDCVGYAPLEPLPLVRELARVVKPGGSVILLAWSSECLLPGYPGLEARLLATASGIAPFVQSKDPAAHFLRALGWFRKEGLVKATACTFAGGANAPLSKDLYAALCALLEMRWPGVEAELCSEDGSMYRCLCRPQSPDFILDHPDYCAFFTYTMFRAWVKASKI